jgi:ATP-binding cassette subfamily B protein
VIFQAVRAVRPFVADARVVVVGLALAGVVGGLTEAGALLITVRTAIDLSGAGRSPANIEFAGFEISARVAIVSAAGLAVVSLGCHMVMARMSARVSAGVLRRSRDLAVRHFVAADWATQALQSEGALHDTIGALSQRTSQLAQGLANGASHAVTLAMVLTLSLVVDPVATGLLVIGGLVLVLVLRPVGMVTKRRAARAALANRDYVDAVSRAVGTSMELKVFGVQHVAEAELGRASERTGLAQFGARFMTLFGSSLFKDLAVLLLVAAVGTLVFTESSSLVGIGVVIALVVRSLASAQQVNMATHSVIENLPSVELLRARIDDLAEAAVRSGTRPLSGISSIVFDEVGYQYPGGGLALCGVSIELGEGDALGVIGPSGGGKSTLVQVLLRLRPPTSGQLLVNDKPYTDFDNADWSKLIGFVPQEPSLLSATVADNISFFREIPRSKVEAVARAANVFDDIQRLPEGFDTVLGPRGTGLSGGQKQRVAIARALAGDPHLLVMDEPSSALDARSEQILHELIATLKRSVTMVIVAHRLKTVEACDRLVVLEGGRVTQLGSPEDLMSSEGFYRSVQRLLAG